ncbi:15099_t:CDS:2, partial [Funneliformis geosporum]
MESWNVYSQNTHETPSSTWLCPQNNSHGTDWLQPQNNTSIERERNENMDRLFDLKIGNQEDMLNNNVYNNEDFSSFLNSSESVVPVSTSQNTTVPISNATSNRNVINSPTPSLVTDDDQDQLYNIHEQLVQYPIVTSASFIPSNSIANDFQQKQRQIQNPTSTSVSFTHSISDTTEHERQTLNASKRSVSSSPISQSTSPIVVNESQKLVQLSNEREQRANYSMKSTSFYQSDDKQDLYFQEVRQRLFPSMNETVLSAAPRNLDNRDQYLQAKKHDPKQLLLPLTINKPSTDVVTITSPLSSLATDDDEMDICEQTQHRKSNRQSNYQDFQLSISTNDLPMQQPSPASSEYFSSNTKTPPSSHDTTPKEKKRRTSQRKINSKRPAKLHDEA